MFYKKWLVNFTSLNCNLKNGPKLSHFGRAKLRRSKNGSVSAEQPCCRPNQAIFPLNIDSGFMVNAPVTSNTAALSTARSKTNGTLGRTKLLYCNFEHVPTRILKQMIYHWKALIQSSLNQEKNWTWHHPRDGHAHLTEKASLLLKPVWSLP